jgi:hypothetical protein
MANPVTLQVGNVKLTAEKPVTSGNLTKTVKLWFESTKGAFDFMQTLKKVAVLCGNEHLETQSKRYIAGTSIMRVPSTVIAINDTIQAYKKDKVFDLQRKADFSHQLFDCGTMLAYSTAFFGKNVANPLKAAAILSLGNDLTDAASFGVKINHGLEWKQRLVSAGPLLQRANHNILVNSFLKLIKAVTGFVAGIFASFALFTGAVLISPTIAVTIALSSTIFSILAHYHNNYWCDSFLKIEYMPQKFA